MSLLRGLDVSFVCDLLPIHVFNYSLLWLYEEASTDKSFFVFTVPCIGILEGS